MRTKQKAVTENKENVKEIQENHKQYQRKILLMALGRWVLRRDFSAL